MRPFDAAKFRKSITKNISGLSTGFRDPKVWISTGNYALNYKISGSFDKGIPLGKFTTLAGESGSGKSFLAAGNLTREAQKQGIFVVMIDSENALDEEWLHKMGVDTDESKLLKINAAMIDDVANIISNFVKEYKLEYESEPEENRPKILFVVDSLGMLLTPTDVTQFEKGDMKGDMGRKAKQLRALVVNCVNQFAQYDIGLVATNHTYQSQDMFDPDDKITGGQGFIYASSIVIALKKYKLKKDETGTKTSKVYGIRAKAKIMKTRFFKPFEEVEIEIPYDRGMDPYSGLFDLFVEKGKLEKTGNKYTYIDNENKEYKLFEREINQNKDGVLDLIMSEWNLEPIEEKVEENENELE